MVVPIPAKTKAEREKEYNDAIEDAKNKLKTEAEDFLDYYAGKYRSKASWVIAAYTLLGGFIGLLCSAPLGFLWFDNAGILILITGVVIGYSVGSAKAEDMKYRAFMARLVVEMYKTSKK